MQDPNHQMSLYIIQQPIEPYVGMMFAAEKSRFCAIFSFIHFFVKRGLPRSKGCEVGICSQKRAKSFKGSTIMDWVMVRRFTSLAFGSSRSTYYIFFSHFLYYTYEILGFLFRCLRLLFQYFFFKSTSISSFSHWQTEKLSHCCRKGNISRCSIIL